MATDHPLFIFRYMDRTRPQKDSGRFRNRVAAGFIEDTRVRSALANELVYRTGIEIGNAHWSGEPLWDEFFSKRPLDEVLTAITVAIQNTKGGPYRQWSNHFRQHVGEALRDENLGLRIDDGGVIHYSVDEEFESVRLAAIAVLNDPALAAAKNAYEDAFRHLDAHPPETKASLRSMFESLEVVAKQVAEYDKLNAAVCRGRLKEHAVALLGGDEVQRRVVAGMFDSLAEWVDAMHMYRHGQPDNFQPPTEQFTVFALSSGGSFLRLLAQAALAKNKK